MRHSTFCCAEDLGDGCRKYHCSGLEAEVYSEELFRKYLMLAATPKIFMDKLANYSIDDRKRSGTKVYTKVEEETAAAVAAQPGCMDELSGLQMGTYEAVVSSSG